MVLKIVWENSNGASNCVRKQEWCLRLCGELVMGFKIVWGNSNGT